MITKQKEKEIYELLMLENEKYGKFNKCIFHLHTPASYDYCLYEKNRGKSENNKENYWNLTDEDLYDIAIKENLLFDKGRLKYNRNIFLSEKEYISYLLIADKIINADVTTVVISDHNTINGYKKLIEAINVHKKSKITKVYPEVILGIEISCADLNHIVAMFDSNAYDRVNRFIEEYIIDEQKGTYLSSIDVIEKVKEMQGYSYIAHINSSNIFNKDFLSGAYKEKLFLNPELKIIGVSDKNEKESVENKLKNITKEKKFNFIVDTDSHSIDTILNKIVWLKGKKTDFRIIRDLYRDYDITVSLDEPKKEHQYIKGIVIENDESNFLCSKKYKNDKKDKYLIINFSHSLNCIIGGRGSGKSTILNIIEFMLSLRVKSENELEMICKHKCIWLYFIDNKKEYIVKLMPPKKEYDDDCIMKCFQDIPYGYNTYNSKFNLDEEKIKKYTLRKYMELYEVKKIDNDKFDIEKHTGAKMSVLELLFKKAYSINEMVKIASNDKEIDKYINDLIIQNKDLIQNDRLKSATTLKELKRNYNKLIEITEKRRKFVNEILDKYNTINKNKLRIVYLTKSTLDLSNIYIDFRKNSQYITLDEKKYNITEESVKDYFYFIMKKIGVEKFLKLLITKDVDEILKIEDISSWGMEFDIKKVERGIEQVTISNSKYILSKILNELVSDDRCSELNNILKEYLKEMDEFTLEFNVNNKDKKEIFRNIQQLSLGQKVVAMLSLVLSYSDFSNDYTPLIIDQPEDNLDSQYIYKFLVEDLKKIKEKRQVIIATHNSTIVTNTKTENVMVMESDNEKGWIECTGYPTEATILRNILKYLEGGKESFNHKKSLYNDIL